MRIYEFSKQFGISNKNLIEVLHKNGFTVSNHMSVLTPDALSFLKKHVAGDAQEEKKSNKQSVAKEAARDSQQQANADKDAMQITPKKESQKIASTPVETKSIEKNRPAYKVQERPIRKTASFTKEVAVPEVVIPAVLMLEPTTVADVALIAKKPVSEVIMTLLKSGVISNKNQLLSVDLVEKLATAFQIPTEKPQQKQQDIKRAQQVTTANAQERMPIVVVVGHVDHGKTTLLDFIRNTRVASREKGGITQHLGAYQAHTQQGDIVFLDTPGHEAFSKMRSRGIKVADIAILVVAADDSVMPQTIEAIKHIKEIDIPIIVAVNKIDKVDIARVDIVKRDLGVHGLMPEEWGGDVIYAPISAKMGTGIDHLLEVVILQSQLMELKADPSVEASGYALESRLEKGRGPVATLLLQQGTLRIGDNFSCGATMGKVNSITDSYGKRLQSVGPSVPVQVAGFEALPEAGDFFEVVSKDNLRKAKATLHDKKMLGTQSRIAKPGAKNIIVKTDSNSSKEALTESIVKLSMKTEKGFNIVQAGVGAVVESDVMLAADTNSDIVTLHVKAEPNALLLAQRLGVTVTTYDIIYKLLEALEGYAQSVKEVKLVRKRIGEAVVRKVFDIKGVGVIAGSYVKDGIITRDCNLVNWRGKHKIGEGKISSLQRDKKTVKEVHTGFECGFMIEGFGDWQPDDRVECFIMVPEGSK